MKPALWCSGFRGAARIGEATANNVSARVAVINIARHVSRGHNLIPAPVGHATEDSGKITQDCVGVVPVLNVHVAGITWFGTVAPLPSGTI